MPQKKRWRNVILFGSGVLVAYVAGCYQLAKGYLTPLVEPVGAPAEGLAEGDLGGVPVWKKPGKDTFVLVHGYGGNQAYWSGIASDLAREGYGVVVPKLPGHNDPADTTTGFGVKEAERLVKVTKAIRADDPNGRIVLVGVSMGGAASWLATERGAEADGVVSDGAFARFDEAMTNWFERKATGSSIYLKPVVWIASGISGLSPADVIPMDSAAKWKGKPALIIQGENDTLIPMSHAERLAIAAGCDTWVVPKAAHAECCDIAREQYVDRLERFLDALPAKTASNLKTE